VEREMETRRPTGPPPMIITDIGGLVIVMEKNETVRDGNEEEGEEAKEEVEEGYICRRGG
jgi:hypothetical protein